MRLLLILFLFALIISCSTTPIPDGPPDFYVDESKVSNAVPHVEPLAKLGNMPSYVVFGRRYYTLKNARNYEEVGIASWYGKKFHHHRTSSGEVYDMIGMTAAHRTLPLPSYVEVTNLKNNRKVIVKVNDRGPFSGNRIIDLSYVAAKKLGMIGHGTTQVRLKVLDPRRWGKSILASRTPQIFLQVGVFRNKMNAANLKTKLISLLHVPVGITLPSSSSSYYKVRVGPIVDRETADNLSKRLTNLGFKPNKLGI